MLYMSLWQLLQAHFLTIYSYNKFREEVCQFECRISIPQLQVRGALSGG
jgi:glutaredoxin-related protein